jgi:hypothetical protein
MKSEWSFIDMQAVWIECHTRVLAARYPYGILHSPFRTEHGSVVLSGLSGCLYDTFLAIKIDPT